MDIISDRLTAWFTTSNVRNEYYRFVLSANQQRPEPIFKERRRTPNRRRQLSDQMKVVFEMTIPTSDGRNSFQERLIKLGTQCAAFIPREILDPLFAATGPLVIETTDPIFPWELVYHNNQFLGTWRPIGRLSSLSGTRHQPVGAWDGLQQATLIGNGAPATAGGDGLNYPPEEVQQIASILQYMQPAYEGEPLMPTQFRRDAFARILNRHHVIFHYAGHIIMSQDGSAEIGLGLQSSDGLPITAADVEKADGRFLFVFLNGCRSNGINEHNLLETPSGQQAIQDSATIAPILKGLAMAFREHGSVAVICTLWPVEDAVACQFAKAVYTCLQWGMSVGEALQKARAALYQRRPLDPNWASYILYGDPTLTLAAMQGAGDASHTSHQPRNADLATFFEVEPDVHRNRNGVIQPSADINAPDDDGDDDAGAGTATNAENGDAPQDSEVIHDDEDIPITPVNLKEKRIEQILTSSAIASILPPAPDLNAALDATCRWLQLEDWNIMSRLDLLVGLAQMPESPVAAALVAVDCSAAVLAHTTHASFGRGTERGHSWATDPFTRSSRISLAIEAAAMSARQEGATAVTARHLALALLQPPLTGTMHAVLEKILGISGKQLWETLRTGNAPTTPPPALSPMPITLGERDIFDARLPIDLIAREQMLGEDDLREPLAERPDQIQALVSRLRLPADHHVLLTGPQGVGKQSLITLLARYLPDHQGQVALAGIQGWGIFLLPVEPGGNQGAWLQAAVEQLVQRRGPSIIVFANLTLLLDDPTAMQMLPQILQMPSLRCITLATPAEADRLRREQRGLFQDFTPILLATPRPEVAERWVALRLDYLGRRARVTFAPDAVAAATTRATDHQTQTALPGFVQAYLLAAEGLVSAEAGDTMLDNDTLPLVTAEHVRRASLP